MSVMFSSPKFTPNLAKAPFDDSRADIILRSSDDVNFRVFKIILSLASPVFAQMFSTPQSASHKPADELPVVTISEDSQALDLALRHCYPTRSPELVELKDAHILLEFAHKYQVDALCPSLTRYLTSTIERDPVSVYALATKYQYKDVAIAAARSCLKLPVSRLRSGVLHCITGEEYRTLVEYHTSCGAAASAIALERKWFPLGNKLYSIVPTKLGSDSGCTSCMMRDFLSDMPPTSSGPFTFSKSAPRFLWSYLHRSALVLAHHPSAEAVTAEAFVLKHLDCAVCLTNKRADMLEFSRVFATEIIKAIEKIPLFETEVDTKAIAPSPPSALGNSDTTTVNGSASSQLGSA
ncbi:hypothetical protein BJV78DRAFT_572491 [Lactifluus subvellereus]|nr:hypothetical protein BJV78DRAFT_572491 [Lactifluus subvellereus]